MRPALDHRLERLVERLGRRHARRHARRRIRLGGQRADLDLALLVDAQRDGEASTTAVTGVVHAFLAAGAVVEDRGDGVAHGGSRVAATAAVCRRAAEARGVETVCRVRALVRIVLFAERLEVEDALEESPGHGQVGGDEGGGRLADVPEGPVEAKGLGEAVVLVEDGRDDLYALDKVPVGEISGGCNIP